MLAEYKKFDFTELKDFGDWARGQNNVKLKYPMTTVYSIISD